MTHTTTPPASGAAQMRKACVALAQKFVDTEWTRQHPEAGLTASLIVQGLSTLPLPAEPHAEQIAALTEAAGALKSVLHLIKPSADDYPCEDMLEGLPDSHLFELTWAPENPAYPTITAGQLRRLRAALARIYESKEGRAMAYADYRLCDVCGGKTFYDANLNYQEPDAEHGHEWWLHGVGDWAVICPECAKEFKCEVVNRERDMPK